MWICHFYSKCLTCTNHLPLGCCLDSLSQSESLMCKYCKETIIKYIIFMEMYTDTSSAHPPTASLLAQPGEGGTGSAPIPRAPSSTGKPGPAGKSWFLSSFLSTCQHLQTLQAEGMSRRGEQGLYIDKYWHIWDMPLRVRWGFFHCPCPNPQEPGNTETGVEVLRMRAEFIAETGHIHW